MFKTAKPTTHHKTVDGDGLDSDGLYHQVMSNLQMINEGVLQKLVNFLRA